MLPPQHFVDLSEVAHAAFESFKSALALMLLGDMLDELSVKEGDRIVKLSILLCEGHELGSLLFGELDLNVELSKELGTFFCAWLWVVAVVKKD
jgi:hypothetical protein